jgi:hypothetical protein
MNAPGVRCIGEVTPLAKSGQRAGGGRRAGPECMVVGEAERAGRERGAAGIR